MKKNVLITFVCLLLACPVQAQQLITHPWQGKRVAYFGDSITDPRNKASKKKYWGFLNDWLQIEPYVYGVSGRQWNDIPRQTDLCKQEHGDSIDAILILMGTNDFNNDVPLGQWFKEQRDTVTAGHGVVKHIQHRLHRVPDMNPDTYRGRINIALDKLKRVYPTKQIILLTPLHRSGFFANEKNWQPDEAYANQVDRYISAYVDAVKEAGDVWALPVINLSAAGGLMPQLDEQAQYFKNAANDRLHPNDKGHYRLARTLYYQLLTLPCTF